MNFVFDGFILPRPIRLPWNREIEISEIMISEEITDATLLIDQQSHQLILQQRNGPGAVAIPLILCIAIGHKTDIIYKQ